MECGECRDGQMVAAPAPRVSARFRVFGYLIALAGLLIVLLGAGWGPASTRSAGAAERDAVLEARHDAVLQLRQLDGMLDSLVTDFEGAGTVSEVALSQLPDNERVLAESIIAQYETGLVAVVTGSPVAPNRGGDARVASWAIGLSLLGAGGLLAVNKKVWQCRSCGSIRAA